LVFLFTQNQQNFPICSHENYNLLLVDKLVKNCMINSLTSIYEVKNGELISNPYLNKQLFSLYEELMSVFPYVKDTLPLKEIEFLCKRTANNTSSMSADLLANRPTEVDAIIGFSLKSAREKNIDVPMLQFLYDGICAIEFRKGIRA